MQGRNVQDVPIQKLVCRPQVRQASGFGDEEIAGLAQSIVESGGILQPLLVRRDGDALIVLDGERRLRAAKRAGLSTVPVIIDDRAMSDAEVTQRQLVLDAQRVGLNPMERARAINKLVADAGWSEAQVAVKLGLSPPTVSKLLALLLLPDDVQEKVASGRLAMSAAYELAKLPECPERGTLVAEAVSGRLTRDGVVAKSRDITSNRRAAKPRRPPIRRDRVVFQLGEGRSVSVSGMELSLEGVVEWLTSLVTLLRSAGNGSSLADLAKLAADKARRG